MYARNETRYEIHSTDNPEKAALPKSFTAVERPREFLWKFATPDGSEGHDRVNSTPAAGPDGTVYFATSALGDTAYAVDGRTGRKKWAYELRYKEKRAPRPSARTGLCISVTDCTAVRCMRWTHGWETKHGFSKPRAACSHRLPSGPTAWSIWGPTLPGLCGGRIDRHGCRLDAG